MGQWKVVIDRDMCVGSGTCVAVANGLFTMDDEDRSVPVAATFAELPALLQAAQLCPTRAIDVLDAQTGASVA